MVNARHKLTILGAIVTGLFLAGCTASAPEPAPETTQEETPAEVTDRVADSEPKDKAVEPDEEVMASMTCAPLDDAQLEKLRLFGLFERGVTVEVLQEENETWWVLVADSAGEDGDSWTRSAYLTNGLDQAPAEERYRSGTWIELDERDPWENVDWDEERLVRAQSALTLAEQTLGELP